MPEIRELTVAGRYDSIPIITRFVSEAAAAAHMTEQENYHCQMSVDEACTNVIEHAHGEEDSGSIHIRCIIEHGLCTIEIIDTGRPFEPESVPEPQISPDVEQLQPGGLGLHLMRKFMDEVSFTFEPGRNILKLVKRHTPELTLIAHEPMLAQHTASGIRVVSPQGRLNSSVAPDLEEVLTAFLQQGHSRIVVDFSNVDYISSRGLKTLVNAWKTARGAGGDLLLSSVNAHVYEVIEMVGFNQVFQIHASLAGAVAALDG
ncbi:MAG: anti-sigma factor antagonist [Anaerolineae bacterium]